MNYEILSIYNNNVILAKQDQGKNMVIVGKGVGFGKKPGDLCMPQSNEEEWKLYHILDEAMDSRLAQKLGYDLEQLERIMKHITSEAQLVLEIHNDKLCSALMDHIAFALQRTRMGLTIENPFITEIQILYKKEFDFAKYAVEYINQELDVDMGEAEQGFIALHLFSAKYTREVSNTLKRTKAFQELVQWIKTYRKDEASDGNVYQLLWAIRLLVRWESEGGEKVELPILGDVKSKMERYYEIARLALGKLGNELKMDFSEDTIATFAIDIYKFINS